MSGFDFDIVTLQRSHFCAPQAMISAGMGTRGVSDERRKTANECGKTRSERAR
jgi:hypothetical protein